MATELMPKLEFRNPVVNSIDSTATPAIERGLVHLQLDEQVLDGRLIQIGGKEFVNFASCSYFGLEIDQRLKRAVAEAANCYGSSFIMSRTYASSPPFARFEEQLSQIFDAFPVVTPSTTLGHLAAFGVLIQAGDTVLVDQFAHNSMQLALQTLKDKAAIRSVRHNDFEHLRNEVKRVVDGNSRGVVWYVGDGIYSMLGDRCHIDQVVQLLNEFPTLFAYLDDAHGMSIEGLHGRGFVMGAQDRLHPKMVVAVSLSKCFGIGCGGVIVLPHQDWQRKLRICGSTIIFSSPIPPPMLGAGIASADIHLSDEILSMQTEWRRLVEYFKQRATMRALPLASTDIAPMQFVPVGSAARAMDVIQKVMHDGFFVNLCAYPAVPHDQCGLRLTITRHCSKSDIDDMVDSITKQM